MIDDGVRIFPLGKQAYCQANICVPQTHLMHDASCNLNFLLRHSPVGLGDMPHHQEGGFEKYLAALGTGERPGALAR